MMNREFIFRIWDENFKEFKYINEPNDFKFYQSGYGDNPESKWPDNMTQSTGLFDRNGTRIFEGDILQFTESWVESAIGYLSGPLEYGIVQGEVIFKEGAFGMDITYECNTIDGNRFYSFSELDYQLGPDFVATEVEVIGNIFDNPELINREIIDENE